MCSRDKDQTACNTRASNDSELGVIAEAAAALCAVSEAQLQTRTPAQRL